MTWRCWASVWKRRRRWPNCATRRSKSNALSHLASVGHHRSAGVADAAGAGRRQLGALTLSFRTLWREPFSDAARHIWLNIRLPRVLLAVVIGCALAVSGAVMQGLFRNPLADPSLLGISSGARCLSPCSS